jgi:signal peptidase I
VQDGEKGLLIAAAATDLLAEVLSRFGEVRLRVSGTSMLPAIRPGDILVVRRCVFEDVHSGDVVVFRAGQRLFAHRVAGKHAGSETDALITKGDALSQQDPAVSASNVLGRVTEIRSSRPAPRARRTRLLFRVLFRVARLFDHAGRAMFYFAAGTLQRADLEDMTAIAWDDFGTDDEVAASGLMSWERATVHEFLKPTDRVLLVGCGSGRDLLPLKQAGHDVVGVEPATRAVERARFEHAELPGKFDAIVFSWFSYCYILGAAARTAALGKARAHLNPAGRIVISYIASETPRRSRATMFARAASQLTGADWRAEPNDHFFPSAGRMPIYTFQHSFAPAEVRREARNAGLFVLAERRFPEAFLVVLTADPDSTALDPAAT